MLFRDKIPYFGGGNLSFLGGGGGGIALKPEIEEAPYCLFNFCVCVCVRACLCARVSKSVSVWSNLFFVKGGGGGCHKP